MIKLAPLDIFERILLPYTEQPRTYDRFGKELLVEEFDMTSPEFSLGWAHKRFLLKWNRLLYQRIKYANVDFSKLETKPAKRYLQFGRYRIVGGMKLWIVKEPTITTWVDKCQLSCEYMATINLKEMFLVIQEKG